MLLRTVDGGNFRDVPIEEGEMFLLPGQPHRRTLSFPVSYLPSQYSSQPCPVPKYNWPCH